MDQRRVQILCSTPLFLHGAGKNSLELRAPSAKGALRYWYRAWYGRYLGLEQLRKQEAGHLGSAGGGQSSLLMRIIGPGTPRTSNATLPFAGISAQAIRAGEEFEIVFTSRGSLDWLMTPLALWLHCGGLGQRARRGGGTLDASLPFPDLQAAHESTLANLKIAAWPKVPVPSAWPILSPTAARIVEIDTDAPDALAAIKLVEVVYKSYRSGLVDKTLLGSIKMGTGSHRLASPIHIRPFLRGAKWWVRVTVFFAAAREGPYPARPQALALGGLIRALPKRQEVRMGT